MKASIVLSLLVFVSLTIATPFDSDEIDTNKVPGSTSAAADKTSKESVEDEDRSSVSQASDARAAGPNSDLEISHSDTSETKVAAVETSAKDEKLGTADNFPIGFATPNLLPYDAPLFSGSYGPDLGLGAPGVGPYNSFAGRGPYYRGHGGLLRNPYLGRGIGYGNYDRYDELALEQLARERLLLQKERQLRIQEELVHRQGKLLDDPYGGRNPYGEVGYGGAERGGYGGYDERIAIQKETGIDSYGGIGELGLKGVGPSGVPFGRSQYPINLNPRFNQYQNLGLGLNGYNQRLAELGGYNGEYGLNQFGGQGGLGYQNLAAEQVLIAKRKGALGRGYNPDLLLDPAYSQNYDSVQQGQEAKSTIAFKPKEKSPYGFYSSASTNTQDN